MLFMPDMSMVEHRSDDQVIHRHFITDIRSVGQRKDIARPTPFNLHDHLACGKLRDGAGA